VPSKTWATNEKVQSLRAPKHIPKEFVVRIKRYILFFEIYLTDLVLA
jgi:hypothetical protein